MNCNTLKDEPNLKIIKEKQVKENLTEEFHNKKEKSLDSSLEVVNDLETKETKKEKYLENDQSEKKENGFVNSVDTTEKSDDEEKIEKKEEISLIDHIKN